MVNKKLAEWLKAEETQGFPENQLVAFSLKKGFKKRDIEEAILYLKQKFSIKVIFKIPSYLIVLFFIFLLSLGWALGEFLSSVLLSGAIIGSVFQMSYFEKKNMDLLSWALFVTLYILYIFIYVPFFIIAIFSLILALIVFFKNKRQINLYLLSMSFLISITLAISTVLLIYIFELIIIIQYLPNMNMIYLALILYAPSLYLLAPVIYIYNKLALSRIDIYQLSPDTVIR